MSGSEIDVFESQLDPTLHSVRTERVEHRYRWGATHSQARADVLSGRTVRPRPSGSRIVAPVLTGGSEDWGPMAGEREKFPFGDVTVI